MGENLRKRAVMVVRTAPYACGEPAPMANGQAPRNW